MLNLLVFVVIIHYTNAYHCFNVSMLPINPCDQFSGSCSQYCVNGCEFVRSDNQLNFCVNITNSVPVYTTSSQSCFNNNSIFETDYNCNIYGNGTKCPYGCNWTGHECKPINTYPEQNNVCNPVIEWQCPQFCTYNKHTSSCVPDNPNVVCKFDEKYMLCPYGCTYNSGEKRCIGSSSNPCELSLGIKCPMKCNINVRGDICVGKICNEQITPICPDLCSYDFEKKQCFPTNRNISSRDNIPDCEPYTTATCGFGAYNIDIFQFPSCHNNYINKINDICVVSDNIIRFPTRLMKKYEIIKCKYSPNNIVVPNNNQYCSSYYTCCCDY